MNVRRVLETCLYAKDLEAAEAFYTEVIRLECFAKVEGRHLFFRCGPGVFLIFNPEATMETGGKLPVPPHGAEGPGHAAFAIGENELEPWRQRLAQHRVEIEEEIEWPGGGRSIYFRDPAGNSVELGTPTIWGFEE